MASMTICKISMLQLTSSLLYYFYLLYNTQSPTKLSVTGILFLEHILSLYDKPEDSNFWWARRRQENNSKLFPMVVVVWNKLDVLVVEEYTFDHFSEVFINRRCKVAWRTRSLLDMWSVFCSEWMHQHLECCEVCTVYLFTTEKKMDMLKYLQLVAYAMEILFN